MHPFLRPIALAITGLLLTAQALATNAGWRSIAVPGLQRSYSGREGEFFAASVA